MEEKYKKLEQLYLQMKEIDNLSRKRYSIDLGVRDRAYTDKEYEEDDQLEQEIEEKRKRFIQERQEYAKTFSSMDELTMLENQLKASRLSEHENNGYYDERKYSGMRAILEETKQDFEPLSTHREQNVDDLEK